MMAAGHGRRVLAENTTTGNAAQRNRGTSVRGDGRKYGIQRNLEPITSCAVEMYVCEWRSESDRLKNKYAICVEDEDGNAESKCVDAKYAQAGHDGSDTVTCGCCTSETPSGKGGFKECLSILPSSKPKPCDDTVFNCETGSGKGKGGNGVSFCANVEIGKGSTPTFGISDECGDP